MAWEVKVKVSEYDTSELRLDFETVLSGCGPEIPAFILV